ncbi:MAG TPA: reverse transcriptase family protein [Phycisphaerae bacterium]|nr:reverse transcriptase family protein [Phycisphaerae bacterium]
MGLLDFLKRLFGGGQGEPQLPPPDVGLEVGELSRRLGVDIRVLEDFAPAYHEFSIPKRRGGTRVIAAPSDATKDMHRRILRRLLGRLRVHPAATGFQRGASIVTHANAHAGRAVVLHMDIREFFPSTSAKRVHAYFRRIGWNEHAAKVLTRICTHEGGLPQGAPTSPRLSNLVNYRMDARLSGLARKLALVRTNPKTLEPMPPSKPTAEAFYTRYADDMTFSFAEDDRSAVQSVIFLAQKIVADEGYRLHTKKKLRIMRRCDRQTATGLVVNDRPRLPRDLRRRLRAVRHHLQTGRPATLTEVQLAGWDSLIHMIDTQAQTPQP